MTRIKNWKQFARKIRSKDSNLLRMLDNFPNSVLVTGCQRSGTTLLSRIITQSDGMVNYWFGKDDELDAALILSGYVNHERRGRYCFQITYLNECYQECFKYRKGHRIIWVLRNPYSVIYSLLHNWRRFALNELFRACGVDLLSEKQMRVYNLLGVWGVSRFKRACLSFNGKVSQIFAFKENYTKDNMIVVDYDDLVSRKNAVLPFIYRFIDLPYKTEYGDMIHKKSLNKAARLSRRELTSIEELCVPTYQQARKLLPSL